MGDALLPREPLFHQLLHGRRDGGRTRGPAATSREPSRACGHHLKIRVGEARRYELLHIPVGQEGLLAQLDAASRAVKDASVLLREGHILFAFEERVDGCVQEPDQRYALTRRQLTVGGGHRVLVVRAGDSPLLGPVDLLFTDGVATIDEKELTAGGFVALLALVAEPLLRRDGPGHVEIAPSQKLTIKACFCSSVRAFFQASSSSSVQISSTILSKFSSNSCGSICVACGARR